MHGIEEVVRGTALSNSGVETPMCCAISLFRSVHATSASLTRRASEFLRNQHEGDGIIIGILSDFQFYHVFVPSVLLLQGERYAGEYIARTLSDGKHSSCRSARRFSFRV
jgi:hypothetical protein